MCVLEILLLLLLLIDQVSNMIHESEFGQMYALGIYALHCFAGGTIVISSIMLMKADFTPKSNIRTCAYPLTR